MPREGYKTLTVPTAIYERLLQVYGKNRKKCLKKGITSLSGFLMYLIDEEENRSEIQVKM